MELNRGRKQSEGLTITVNPFFSLVVHFYEVDH